MPSPATRRNILKIIPFGVIWLIFSIVYTLLEKGLLAGLDHYPSTGNEYDFATNIYATPLTALVMGLLIGVLEVKYFSKWFIQKNFTVKILLKSLMYLLLILVFLMITLLVTTTNLLHALSKPDFWSDARAFFSAFSFWSVVVYVGAIVIVTQFYTEVSENIGVAVLHNFFTGKYHRPVEEERIFMFLDMKSSTTIAESLGHIRYFEMLKEYYIDLSAPIIQYSGEVYQYAGDEIVVSWTMKNGLQNNNCIECFLAMKNTLRQQEKKYRERFGLLPSFKAGIHAGKVTTGEIGVIKKEIIFTGDVLNSTARIQALCNTLGADLLISAGLRNKLHPDPRLQVRSAGEKELRGKDEKIELFTITT